MLSFLDDFSFVVFCVVYVVFVGFIIAGFCISDVQERAERQGKPAAPAVVAIRAGVRCTLFVAGVMITLTLCLTPNTLFEDPNFTLGAFLQSDMLGIRNVLHGGFLVGAFSNYAQTGDGRFLTIEQTVIAYLIAPCVVSLGLSVIQLYVFGAAALPFFVVPLLTLVLCPVALVAQRRSFEVATPAERMFNDRVKLIAEGERFVEKALGQSAYSRFVNLRRYGRRFLQMELGCFVLSNIFLFMARVDSAQTSLVSFSSWARGFVEAYSMALHLGWLLGVGFHSFSTNSRKSLELFFYAKLIFTPLSAVEFVCTLVRFITCYFYPLSAAMVHFPGMLDPNGNGLYTNSSTPFGVGNDAAVADFVRSTAIGLVPSLISSGLYTAAQLGSVVCCAKVLRTLGNIGFKTDKYLPPGSYTSASGGGFSVWTLSKLREVPTWLNYWAAHVAIWATAAAVLMQLQATLTVFLVPRIDVLVECCNLALHCIVIFALSYYRAVQNYQERLRHQRMIQMFLYLVYGAMSVYQAVMALGILYTLEGWDGFSIRDGRVQSAIFCVVRAIVCFVCTYSYSHLKLNDPFRDDPRVLCTCCCIVCYRHNPNYNQVTGGQDRDSTAIGFEGEVELQTPPQSESMSEDEHDKPPRPKPAVPTLQPPPADAPQRAEHSRSPFAPSPADVVVAPVQLASPVPKAILVDGLHRRHDLPVATLISASRSFDGAVASPLSLSSPASDDFERTMLISSDRTSSAAPLVIHSGPDQPQAALGGMVGPEASKVVPFDDELGEEDIIAEDILRWAVTTNDAPTGSARFAAARSSALLSLATFLVFMAVLAVAQASRGDLLGLYSISPFAALSDPGSSSMPSAYTVADIAMGHHLAYSMAFHFAFIVAGYGWRGARAANVMFLHFAAACTLAVLFCCSALFLSHFFRMYMGLDLNADLAVALTCQGTGPGTTVMPGASLMDCMGGDRLGLHGMSMAVMVGMVQIDATPTWLYFLGGVMMVMFSTTLVDFMLAAFVQKHIDRYPQRGFSMV